MNLLLDIGNTRLKALWWEAIEQPIAAAAPVQALHHQGQPAAGLAAIDGPRPRRIAIAQVLGPAAEAALAEACRARGWPAPQFARSGEHWRGLRNGYAEPARLGVDRWLALMAVWARHPGEPALVALAGTALTLDAVDRSGQHLGGFIAPGLWTARQALLGATRFPVGETLPPPSRALGRDTESCVRQGPLLQAAGALELIAADQPARAHCWLDGGDAAQLMPLLEARWQRAPHCVLEGLRLLLQDS